MCQASAVQCPGFSGRGSVVGVQWSGFSVQGSVSWVQCPRFSVQGSVVRPIKTLGFRKPIFLILSWYCPFKLDMNSNFLSYVKSIVKISY